MNETLTRLATLNRTIVTTLGEIAEFKPRVWHVVLNKDISRFSKMLTTYRTDLAALDDAMVPFMRVPGHINDVQMKAGQLSILFSTRNVALTSLDEAQTFLSNIEAQIAFKLSTTISLVAIILSVIGIYMSLQTGIPA